MIAPVLLVSNVGRCFPRRGQPVPAVDGVSLELVPGELIALIGPQGAGKTTLLRIVAGLLEPHAGSVRVAGAAAGSRTARIALGFAPEAPIFPPTLTVRELLDYFARFHVAGARRRAQVNEALDWGGLAEVADRRAAGLPLAFVRRLALAQAALGERRVLLLDETLSGVDAVVRRELCDRLQQLAARGVAVLLASADLAAVERLAARVLILQRGRLVRAVPTAAFVRERVLEILLDAPPAAPPPGFRLTPHGLETDLCGATVEAALALCREHRLVVRASRVRMTTLEEAVLHVLGGEAR